MGILFLFVVTRLKFFVFNKVVIKKKEIIRTVPPSVTKVGIRFVLLGMSFKVGFLRGCLS